MKAENIVSLLLLVILLGVLACAICYSVAHNVGYEKGIEHSRLYYEATGEFPSDAWLDYNEGKHHTGIEDIEDSLEIFEGK